MTGVTRRRPRARVVAAALIPLLVTATLCVLLIDDRRSQSRLTVSNAVRSDVANAVTQIRTAIRQQLTAALSVQPAQRIVPAGDIARSGVSLDAATNARDAGTASLDDTARPPSIIAPVYRGAPPSSTQSRRAALVSYRIVPISVHDVLVQLAPDDGGLAVWGPTRLVSSAPHETPAGSQTFTVQMDPINLPGWRVRGWLPGGAVSTAAWYAMALVIIFGVLLAVLLAGMTSRLATARERERRLDRDRALVTGLAPVLQTSLDMGDVVPAVASHLADGLQLAGLSLTHPSPSGERPLFVWGTPPDVRVTPATALPNVLEEGQTIAFSLARGGRLLGGLRVVAGRRLLRDDLLALATCGELLGSALANADAFAQQQELVTQMRSVDELKTVFLSTASHELRTPVSALVGFSTLLLDGWGTLPEQRGRALIERVNSNARRLDGLIEQLLDFSRLERGLPPTEQEFLDVGQAVAEMLAGQPELVAEHTLEMELDEGCVIRGARSALERVVTNLVGNAAKYSPAHTRITVRATSVDQSVLLTVDDEGEGVPPEDRERVFSRFFRGRGDAVSRTRGAGVGLAIVSEYAASMSGVSSVTDSPSGGARFQVMFPLARTAGETRPDPATDTSTDTAGFGATQDGTSMNGTDGATRRFSTRQGEVDARA